jgi:broad specificity phosphatase PhoE
MPSTVTLVRHGETAWSAAGRHTGRTDVPLSEEGERKAARLGERLSGRTFDRVFASPLQRAARTCALAGFGDRAVVDPDLLEWDYGDYEGRTSHEIEADRPGWLIFRDGCPKGEQAADVGARVDRVIKRLRAVDDRAILFSSAHVLRVLAARWLGLSPSEGRLFVLDTASASVLAYEHDSRDEPVIALWNEVSPSSWALR